VEFEVKYLLQSHAVDSVARFLHTRCKPDPSFQSSIISSIYFDDNELRSLSEKLNSDFLKRKVRLRWYRNTASGDHYKDVFLEVKDKRGAKRIKMRAPFDLTPDMLEREELANLQGLLRGRLPMPGHEAIVSHPQPVLEIRYRRERYIEPLSGCRVSLDQQIEVPRINRHLLPGASPARLQTALVEIKGDQADLPSPLRPLIGLGARKASFSKYLAGYARCRNIIFDPR